MDITKAFNMQVEWLGNAAPIRVDKNGYVCLTDIAKFFPRKRLQHWMDNSTTKEFIGVVKDYLNNQNPGDLDLIKVKRGRYEGGTYAHELIAMEFAAWLSPEFKLRVYLEYQNGTQRKDNWNIKRILAAHNYKIQNLAVESAHDPAKHYHYSNEALMLNEIIFGERKGNMRDTATITQLDRLASLEGHNATMIKLDMPYMERKRTLTDFNSEYEQQSIGT